MNPVEAWFNEHVGQPFDFQRSCWDAQLAGKSGLIHAPTGMGKTFSAWLPTLMRWADEHPDSSVWETMPSVGPRVLWITPLRALATDTEENLLRPIRDLKLPWTVQRRTGDVPQSIKNQQRKRLPTALVTTPESLSVLMSYADARDKFQGVQTVIVDEWHELMATKRGTQTELGLARLRAWNPGLQTWGLSATLGNLEEARDTLLGANAAQGELVHGPDHKDFELSTLLPDSMERFPWPGIWASSYCRKSSTRSKRRALRWFSPTPAARPRSGSTKSKPINPNGSAKSHCTTAASNAKPAKPSKTCSGPARSNAASAPVRWTWA